MRGPGYPRRPLSTPLRFYFDFISPYAYLGWTQVQELARRCEAELEPIPVLFAGFLNHHGHKGPAEIEPKRDYTFKHVVRIAADLGVPIAPPPAHPFKPLLGLRLSSIPMGAVDRLRVIDALFRRTWVEGAGITDADGVAATLDALGLRGAELVAQAASPEIKHALKDQTAAAIERGVFGVPTVELRGELFWGQDAFAHVERFAAGDDPVPRDWAQRWRMPVGVRRPQSEA